MSGHMRTFLLGTAQVDRSRVLVAGSVRAGILIAIVVSATMYAGAPFEGVALAIGVLFVALAEAGEEVGRRWRTMMWTNLWLMAAAVLAGLISDYPAAVVLVSAAVAFGTGLAGAAGPRAGVGGVLTLVIFIVFAGEPEVPKAAVGNALLIGLGGLIITAVTIIPTIVRDPRVLRMALSPVPPLWPRIRDHVAGRDAFVRHAVRLAVLIPIATIIAYWSGYPHAYWLPMTIAWVTKPDVEGTVSKVLARVLGTVVGIVVAGVALLLLGVSGYVAALVVAVAGGIAVAFVWANYAVGVAAMTIFVIVMFASDGDNVQEDLVVRLVATILAAAMAIAGSYIWRAPRPS